MKWEEGRSKKGTKERRKEKSFGFLGDDKWNVVEECAHTESEKDGKNKFKMDGGKPRRMKAQKKTQKKKKSKEKRRRRRRRGRSEGGKKFVRKLERL